jgi:hypothetical protein
MAAPTHLYQMGKVGSIAIRDAIENAGGESCPHLHWADQYHSQYPKLGIHYSRVLNHKRKTPVSVIVGVRDPFERIVSGYFQEAETLKLDQNIESSDSAMSTLANRFCSDASVICNWFHHNFYCGLNVLDHRFDPERGYAVIEHLDMRVFLYRQDAIHKLDEPIAKFLGIPNLSIKKKNTGNKKFYADIYKDISRKFKAPQEAAVALTKSSLCTHFYTAQERERMLNRWLNQK